MIKKSLCLVSVVAALALSPSNMEARAAIKQFNQQQESIFEFLADDMEYNKTQIIGKGHVTIINLDYFVTANKEVVAKDIDELSFLARQNCVAFCYEASVGGTIPIIKNLKALTLVNEITKITGILNGTTNYILSRMKENFSFEDALLDAKQKGFAETPTPTHLCNHRQ